MILEVIMAFFASFAFGVLFNIKGKYLFIAGVGGAVGWFLYKFSLNVGISESSSLFIAAVGFSIYCEIGARLFKTPTTILSVCCLIPLVPGYGVYNTMNSFLIKDYIAAIDYAISTLSSSCALALGVILVSTLCRNLKINKFNKSNNNSFKSKVNNLKSAEENY